MPLHETVSAADPIAARESPTEPAADSPPLRKSTTQIIVGISINTEAKGDFFVELDALGELYLKVEDLVSLHLRFDQRRAVLIRNEKYAPLSAVLNIKFAFDEKKLTVDIQGKTTENRQTTIELYPTQTRPPNIYYPRETSAFLNYGLNYIYTNSSGFQSFTATNKLGARSGDVFFVSDSLYTKTETNEQFVRLASSATYERRDDLQWFVLGDQFANSGDLGSTINMGGIGFSKVYKLDPYFITQPMFSLGGVAAYPSQAEIYVDGILAGKHAVAPGTFELKNIYSYGGSHIVEVLLKDPFGNEQKISYPLYFNTQLLREGLHEYSYNVGFVREQFGVKSDEYGKPAFSAFHRYGVTSALNVGARAEGSDGLYNGGISTSLALPWVGSFTVSLAVSSATGQKGSAGSFQYAYQLGNFNASLNVREFSRDYSTVSLPASADMNKFERSLGVGFLAPPLGGIALSYSESKNFLGIDTKVASASFSRSLTKTMSLFATASTTRIQDTTFGFFIGLNFTPAKDVHAAVQYNKTGVANTETVQIQKDTPIGEGLGYRASLNRSDAGASTSYSVNPSLQYNARYGIYSLDTGFQHAGNSTTDSYSASAAGALVYAGGFYGLSRPVSDSFSIVMVGDVPNAVVQNNGQEIGKTDSSGTLIVPTLTSYGQNQITLDSKNMPMDYSISGVNAKIAPPIWSGSCVVFDALKVRSLTGNIYVRKDGAKVPLEFVDISMKVGEKEVQFPTGKGGEFYVENTFPEEVKAGPADKQSCRAIAERRKTGSNYIHPGTYHAWADIEGGRCEMLITFPETEDVITETGEMECIFDAKPGEPEK